jgi:putative oxidoreductase
MKVASLIARILLGLVFFVFGLNGIVPLLPTGPRPSGLAGQFLAALEQSHYALFVSALQVIVNIVLFHLLLAPVGLPVAIAVAILWGIIALHYRKYFSSLFVQRAE